VPTVISETVVNVCHMVLHVLYNASLIVGGPPNFFRQQKLAPYGTDDRLFRTDVAANFKVTWHEN